MGGQVGEIGGFGGGVLAILGVFLGELGFDGEICGGGGLGEQNGSCLVVVGGQVVEIWGDECGLGGHLGHFWGSGAFLGGF